LPSPLQGRLRVLCIVSVAVFFSGPERTTAMLSCISHSVAKFLKNEEGPTAVEYAVMLALIIVVCIAAISALGSNASNTFNYVATQVSTTSS